jgi:hypothetical protein
MITIAAKYMYQMHKKRLSHFHDRPDCLYRVTACVGVGVQQQDPSLYFQGC